MVGTAGCPVNSNYLHLQGGRVRTCALTSPQLLHQFLYPESCWQPTMWGLIHFSLVGWNAAKSTCQIKHDSRSLGLPVKTPIYPNPSSCFYPLASGLNISVLCCYADYTARQVPGFPMMAVHIGTRVSSEEFLWADQVLLHKKNPSLCVTAIARQHFGYVRFVTNDGREFVIFNLGSKRYILSTLISANNSRNSVSGIHGLSSSNVSFSSWIARHLSEKLIVAIKLWTDLTHELSGIPVHTNLEIF